MDLGLTHPPESQQRQETSDSSEADDLLLASINNGLSSLPDGFDLADLGIDIPANLFVDQPDSSMTEQGTPQGLKRFVDETGFDRENSTDCALSESRKKQRTESQVFMNHEDELSPYVQPANHLEAAGQLEGAFEAANPADKTNILDTIPTVPLASPSLNTSPSTGVDRQICTTSSGIPEETVVRSIEGPEGNGTSTVQSAPCQPSQNEAAPLSLPGVSTDENNTNGQDQARANREGSFDSLFGEDIDVSEDPTCEESSVNPTDISSNSHVSHETSPAEKSNAASHANATPPVVPTSVPISLPNAPVTSQSKTPKSIVQNDNGEPRAPATPISLPKAPATSQSQTPNSVVQNDSRQSRAPTSTSAPITLPNVPAAFQSGIHNSTGQEYSSRARASTALTHNHAIHPQDVTACQIRQIMKPVAPPEQPIMPYPKYSGPLEYLPSATNLHTRNVSVGEERLVSRIDALERNISQLQYDKKKLMAQLSEHIDVDPTTGKSKMQILKDENSTLNRQVQTLQAQLKDILFKKEGLTQYCRSLHMANNTLMDQCNSLIHGASAAPWGRPMPVSNAPGTYPQQRPVAMNPVHEAPRAQANAPRPPMFVNNNPGAPPQQQPVVMDPVPGAQPNIPRPPISVANAQMSASMNLDRQAPAAQPSAPRSLMPVDNAPGPPPQQSVATNPVPQVPGYRPQVTTSHSSIPMGSSVSQGPSVAASVAPQPMQQTPTQHPLGPTVSGPTAMITPMSPNSQQTTSQRQLAWPTPAAGSFITPQPVSHTGPPVSQASRPPMLHQPQPRAPTGPLMGPATCAPDNPTVNTPQAPAQMDHPLAAGARLYIHTAAPAGSVAPGFVNGPSLGSQPSMQAAQPIHPSPHQQFPAPVTGPVATTASNPANPVATCPPPVQEQPVHFSAVQPQVRLQTPVPVRLHSIVSQPGTFTPLQPGMQSSSAPNPASIDLTGDQTDGAGGQQSTPRPTSEPERTASPLDDFYKTVRNKNYSWLGQRNHTAPRYRYQPPTYVPPTPQPKSRRNSGNSIGRKTPANSPANRGKVQKTPKRATKASPKGSGGKKAKAVSSAPEPQNLDADGLTPEERECARMLEEEMIASLG